MLTKGWENRGREEGRIEIGDWGLEVGDWRLGIGDWRLEIGDCWLFVVSLKILDKYNNYPYLC